jgi:arginyl-tRNA synthetase
VRAKLDKLLRDALRNLEADGASDVGDLDRAHARIASMLTRMREQRFEPPNPTTVDLAKLALPEEESLMRAFHSYYKAHRILLDETELRNARATLAMATQQVIADALDLLDVSAPTSM